MPAFAGIWDKNFMTTVATFDPGEAIVKIATIKIAIDDFLNMRPPEPEFFGKSLVIDTDELFEIVLNTSVIGRCFGVARTING